MNNQGKSEMNVMNEETINNKLNKKIKVTYLMIFPFRFNKHTNTYKNRVFPDFRSSDQGKYHFNIQVGFVYKSQCKC